MLWKRQIPILIVSLIGFATLLGWFFDQPTFKSFVDDDAARRWLAKGPPFKWPISPPNKVASYTAPLH